MNRVQFSQKVDNLIAAIRMKAMADWATAYGNAQPDSSAHETADNAQAELILAFDVLHNEIEQLRAEKAELLDR